MSFFDSLFGSMDVPELGKAPRWQDFDPNMGVDFSDIAKQLRIRRERRTRRQDLRIDVREGLKIDR